MQKSSPTGQLHSKIALPAFVAKCASIFYIKSNALQLALIPECRLDTIFKGKWHWNGLDMCMTTLTAHFEEDSCRAMFGVQCTQRRLISVGL